MKFKELKEVFANRGVSFCLLLIECVNSGKVDKATFGILASIKPIKCFGKKIMGATVFSRNGFRGIFKHLTFHNCFFCFLSILFN